MDAEGRLGVGTGRHEERRAAPERAVAQERPDRPGWRPFRRLRSGIAHGFGEGRIYLVEEVVSEGPEPSPHERWNWMVRTRRLIAGPSLDRCPRITEIDVERGSLRRHSHIRLTDEQGRRAEELVARAAERYGALLQLGGDSAAEDRGA